MLKEIILKGESKILEFKENLPLNNSLVKTVVAFSNTSGGKLIIGVNNNREIVGIDSQNIFDIQDKIASIIFDNCYPNIIPEIYTLNVDNKILLVIEIFKGNLLPYYIKNEGKNNGVYIRIGATNRKAGYDNILELERQKRHISFDEEIDYNIKWDTLDLTPLKAEFSKIGKELDKDKLLNLKLIKEEHGTLYPSKALLILLGSQENVRIKCSRFRGKTMDIFIDKKEFEGDLFTQLRDTEKFIYNHIHIGAKITSLQRIDVPEIPYEAVREALINAFVHRDYSNLGKDIKLGIYDDILNIVSPGSFPSSLLEEDILNGRSEIRNKTIARVFKELGYIEQWGSGIKRIISYCINSGLKKPLIREVNDFVDVEIYRATEENTLKEGFCEKVISYLDNTDKLDKNEIKEILSEFLLKLN